MNRFFLLLWAAFSIVSSNLLAQATPKEPAGVAVTGKWPPSGYARVVAYRFKLPNEQTEFFSLINKGKLDADQLKQLTMKSAELTKDQVKKLLSRAFSKTKSHPPAACYFPHHIFIFYDANGGVTNALEVCFSCTSVAAVPDLTKPQWYRHDFRGLASLCDELGVWLESRTTKEYSELLFENAAVK